MLRSESEIRTLLLFPLAEKAKQEAVSPIEPESAEGALYIYPKPELERSESKVE